MNLGIDDAIAAANAIMDNATDSYSAQRHPIGQEILKFSERGRKMVCSNRRIVKMCTTLAMAIAQRLPFLHDIFLRRLTSLGD